MMEWTHACCPDCYEELTGYSRHSATVLINKIDEPCCWCEKPNMGIYIRRKPMTGHVHAETK